MVELEANTVIILLGSCLSLLILALLLVFRISSRVHRIEILLLHTVGQAEPVNGTPSDAETSAGGAFEMFLSEDPQRRSLPKAEKFAAYRQWRNEKGLNWSNS